MLDNSGSISCYWETGLALKRDRADLIGMWTGQ